MPREIITLQVGQAGNQIGRRFWEQALEEHCRSSASSPTPQNEAEENGGVTFTESMSSFFHHHDEDDHGNARGIVCPGRLKARAVLVDMEEGPVSETMRGPLGSLFDAQQFVTDVSGAGNNFAHGHYAYGPQYGEGVLEAVRGAAELCDSLQSFFLMHSLGGGTGSGLGTYILGLLEDEFPSVHRFVTVVFPSEDDDVVTSPYNSVLALQQLTAHADCVLPVENQSLMDLTEDRPLQQQRPSSAAASRILSASPPPVLPAAGLVFGSAGKKKRPPSRPAAALPPQQQCGFDDMNGILARVLLDLTASMRFGGDLNVDLNEITTNLVPFPRMHYLMSSLSPLGTASATTNYSEWEAVGASTSHQLKTACAGVFARKNQFIRADPRDGTVLACALLFRGKDLSLADVTTNVKKLHTDLRMVSWNTEGFKIGLCGETGVRGNEPSLLCLTNNSCVAATTFTRLGDRFERLYRRRAMVHHYEEYMDGLAFEEAREDLWGLVEEYRGLEGGGGNGKRRGVSPLFM